MINLPGEQKSGIILVNKPQGITSHDVVDIVRKKLNIRQVGHAGTLDPLAQGLLVILVGKATKLFSKFVNCDKEYIGVLKLGQTTTTGDSQGEILTKKEYTGISEAAIKEAFSQFVGEIEQVPPMVSALRVGGKRLYQLARKGVTIERKARKIQIHSIEVRAINLPLVEFFTHCSKGTYIRQLAQDVGEKLGCGAHIIKINRLRIGHFSLDQAVDINNINESCLLKPSL